jgi:hypothetical protein
MTQEFVTYEQALILKELGFDEPYLGAYYHATKEFTVCDCKVHHARGEHTVIAPLKQQAFRWFREKYGLYPHIFSEPNQRFVWCIRWYVDSLQKEIPVEHGYESSPTYEEAEFACLNKLIELSKL